MVVMRISFMVGGYLPLDKAYVLFFFLNGIKKRTSNAKPPQKSPTFTRLNYYTDLISFKLVGPL